MKIAVNEKRTKMRTQRDTIKISFLILSCAAYRALASIVSDEAFKPQQMIDEKLRMLFLSGNQISSSGIANQIGSTENQVSVKDLLEPQAATTEKKHHHHHSVSQTLINGNHATYVEPPANFKPIIYDYQRPAVTKKMDYELQKFLPSHSSSSQLDSIISELPGAGELQETELDGSIATAPSDNSNQLAWENPPVLGLQLKPSVGRWNDWHDMSVEPDLASSDTLAGDSSGSLLMSASLPSVEKSARLDSAISKEHYKISNAVKQADKSSKSKESNSFPSPKMLQATDVIPSTASVSKLAVAASGNQVEPNSSVKISKRPVGYEQQAVKLRPSNSMIMKEQHVDNAAPLGTEKLQIKSGQQVTTLSSPSSFQQQTSTLISSPSGAQVKGATLNQHSSRLVAIPNQNLLINSQKQVAEIKFPVAQPQPQAQYAHLKLIPQSESTFSSHAEYSPSSSFAKSQQQQQHHQKLPQVKRRRKLQQSNAEVRIQQLVAKSELKHRQQEQQKQELLTPSNSNQVNSLMLANRQQENQLQKVTAGTGERVLRMLATQSGSGLQVKKFPAPIRTDSSKVAATSYLSRRRKLRTLLPVGLSSWFLGGMRDLDGAHWHLPAELLNRLAVNDIDFQQPKGNKRVANNNNSPADETLLFSANAQKELEGPSTSGAQTVAKPMTVPR